MLITKVNKLKADDENNLYFQINSLNFHATYLLNTDEIKSVIDIGNEGKENFYKNLVLIKTAKHLMDEIENEFKFTFSVLRDYEIKKARINNLLKNLDSIHKSYKIELQLIIYNTERSDNQITEIPINNKDFIDSCINKMHEDYYKKTVELYNYMKGVS